MDRFRSSLEQKINLCKHHFVEIYFTVRQFFHHQYTPETRFHQQHRLMRMIMRRDCKSLSLFVVLRLCSSLELMIESSYVVVLHAQRRWAAVVVAEAVVVVKIVVQTGRLNANLLICSSVFWGGKESFALDWRLRLFLVKLIWSCGGQMIVSFTCTYLGLILGAPLKRFYFKPCECEGLCNNSCNFQ